MLLKNFLLISCLLVFFNSSVFVSGTIPKLMNKNVSGTSGSDIETLEKQFYENLQRNQKLLESKQFVKSKSANVNSHKAEHANVVKKFDHHVDAKFAKVGQLNLDTEEDENELSINEIKTLAKDEEEDEDDENGEHIDKSHKVKKHKNEHHDEVHNNKLEEVELQLPKELKQYKQKALKLIESSVSNAVEHELKARGKTFAHAMKSALKGTPIKLSEEEYVGEDKLDVLKVASKASKLAFKTAEKKGKVSKVEENPLDVSEIVNTKKTSPLEEAAKGKEIAETSSERPIAKMKVKESEAEVNVNEIVQKDLSIDAEKSEVLGLMLQ